MEIQTINCRHEERNPYFLARLRHAYARKAEPCQACRSPSFPLPRYLGSFFSFFCLLMVFIGGSPVSLAVRSLLLFIACMCSQKKMLLKRDQQTAQFRLFMTFLFLFLYSTLHNLSYFQMCLQLASRDLDQDCPPSAASPPPPPGRQIPSPCLKLHVRRLHACRGSEPALACSLAANQPASPLVRPSSRRRYLISSSELAWRPCFAGSDGSTIVPDYRDPVLFFFFWALSSNRSSVAVHTVAL